MKPLRSSLAIGMILLAALALAACYGSSGTVMGNGTGHVQIVMTAGSGTLQSTALGARAQGSTVAPGLSGTASGALPQCAQSGVTLEAANVALSSILARTLDGKLIDVTIDLPYTVDLLALGTGNTVTLPIGSLPPGTYDQIVVVMNRVEFVLTDGTKIAITPPGGGWTAIVRVGEPFTVVEGQTTTVTLQFRRDLSFACGGDGWQFDPQFDCGGHHDSGDGHH